MRKLTLSSPAFEDNELMPKKYSCQGEEINPPLEITGVPKNTKSLTLLMEDPDIPFFLFFMSPFTHWLLCHLEPETTTIKEGNVPDNTIVGKNSMRQNTYIGPCPPWGTHRYIFHLYALDEKLPVTVKHRKKHVLKAMKGHIIEETTLVGLYSKK